MGTLLCIQLSNQNEYRKYKYNGNTKCYFFRYDELLIGYPWNATYVTSQYDLYGQTFTSDFIVHFMSDGSVNNRGFNLEYYAGNINQ